MKKRFLIAMFVVICMSILVVVASAAAPIPQKPTLDVDFGTVTTIDGFTPPSQLYVNTTQRVLLVDEDGKYVTYPTYYVTKDSTTFDVNFNSLNSATGANYSKASIAMIEIPNGVTTISNNTFSGTGYTVCQYVQFPGTITTFGNNVFNTNKACRVVEFIDGTEPLAIGDGMFSGAWNGGTVAEYVKFPNNAVSIGNNTFGKTLTNKTIIFGENLESIGTGFFGETTPRDKDTFIYMPEKFFADTSKVFANLFGNHGPYHNNHLRLTIFYTGSQENAKKLADACAALQEGYVFNNATFVSANEYVYETHKPAKDLSATIVYDYGKCDAFYNGVHNTVKQNACVEACTNCGVGTIKHADANAENVTLSYADGFLNVGAKKTVCSNKGCGYDVTVDAPIIFQTNGYSIPENGRGGLAINFAVNKDALADYEAINQEKLEYGAFAVAYNNIGENNILEMEKAVCVEIDRSYASFEMKLTGFVTEAQMTAEISMGMYVIDKNGNVIYLQPNLPNEGEKYAHISYNTIYNKAA